MAKTRAFLNGKIYTVNKEQPWAEAVVVEGNKIVYVGDNLGAKKYINDDTEVEDLEGKLMTPGLIDGHLHALMATLALSVIRLDPSMDVPTIQKAIKQYMDEYPNLPAYLGMGWADSMFGEIGPNKKDLDAVLTDKPICLFSASGHCGWVNSKALEAANINKDTKDPNRVTGHYYMRDENGVPTGYVKETICLNQILSAVDYTPLELIGEQAVKLGQTCASLGLTSLVDCGNYDFFEFIMNDDLMREIEHVDCPVRIDCCGVIGNKSNIEYASKEAISLHERYMGDMFRCTFLKLLNDGTLENFSAALPKAYPGAPIVQPTFTVEEVVRYGEMAAKKGMDLNVHAIGSVTVHQLLEAAGILREKGYKDMRIVCSHSAYVFKEDLELFKKYNVVANSTALWFSAIPEEEEGLVSDITGALSYPIGSIKNLGGRISLSSDFPTDATAFFPLPNFEVAITRQTLGQKDSYICDEKERLTLEEVIEAYTINNAYIMRMEDKIGSIEVGKYADMVVFNENLFKIDPYKIHEAKVYETIMNGVTRFKL